MTLRRWADEGRAGVVRVGRERRFSSVDLDRLLGREMVTERREALYLRVSGSSGQESLVAEACESAGPAWTGCFGHVGRVEPAWCG